MTGTLEVKGRSRCSREEKIKKAELLGLMRVLDMNSRPPRVSKGSGKVKPAMPRNGASGTRLSQATLALLRQYFALCIALRSEYNGAEGV